MKKTAAAIVVLAVCACGGKSSNGSGSTGTGTGTGTGSPDGGPAPTVTVQLNLVGAGTGRVTSQPPGIDCPGACAMAVAPGTAVTLTAVADANSHFEGYGGGCSGLSCALTADANTKPVFANFSSTALAPGSHTVSVILVGPGNIVSIPRGIDCPGVCSAPFPDGSTVALSPGQTDGNLLSWSGPCTGSGSCTLTLTADASATATFTDPCAGIVVPTPSPQNAQVFQVPDPGGSCTSATSDEAGVVYVTGTNPDGAVTVFSSAGGHVAGVVPFAPLSAGFAALESRSATSTAPAALQDEAFRPDGALASTTALPAGRATEGLGANGGTVVAVAECAATAAEGDTTFALARFDDANAQQGATATFTSQGCPDDAAGQSAVLVDANGLTLLVYGTGATGLFGLPGGRLAARWFDAAGAPVTGWFDAGASDGTPFLVRPLIGGGAAIRTGGTWPATVPSGKDVLAAGPFFEHSDHDPRIVFGGKAYALLPRSQDAVGPIVIAAANGKECGTVPILAAPRDTIAVGKDGSYLVLPAANSCAVQIFPQLFE